MKNMRKLSLLKQILSLVLSVVLLAGIAYIPKVVTVSADSEYGDEFDESENDGLLEDDVTIAAEEPTITAEDPTILPDPVIFNQQIVGANNNGINFAQFGNTYEQLVKSDESINSNSHPVTIELYKTVTGMPENKTKTFTFCLYELIYEKDESGKLKPVAGALIEEKPLTTGNTSVLYDPKDPATYKIVTFEVEVECVSLDDGIYLNDECGTIIGKAEYIIKEVDPGENWATAPEPSDIIVTVWVVDIDNKIQVYREYTYLKELGVSKGDTPEDTPPCRLANVYTRPQDVNVRVKKVLQDYYKNEIPLTGSYEITLVNDEFIPNDVYTFTLDSGNDWEMSMNIPEGIYYISETSGGNGYDVSFLPELGENNEIEIVADGDNDFSIIVTNKEKPIPVKVKKILQDCNGNEIDLKDSDSYTVTLENGNGNKYTFVLNAENNWGKLSNAVQGVPKGIYYISETIGGDNYKVSFSPVKDGTDNRVEISQNDENEFVITVINKEKPKEPDKPKEDDESGDDKKPTTTTESSTTTTQPATNVEPVTKPKTEPSTEPTINTTEEPTTDPKTEPSIENGAETVTEPTIDNDNDSAANPADINNEDDEDLYIIIDLGDKADEIVPLINIEIPENYGALPENPMALDNIQSTKMEELRDNPQTGDNFIFICILFGLMFLSGTTMLTAKKKFYNLIK